MWYEPSTQRVFETHSDIRTAFPGSSLPSVISDAVIEELGLFRLTKTDKPDHDICSQKVIAEDPVQTSDGYEIRWRIEDLSPDDAAQALSREKSAKNSEINACRLATNRSSFEHQGKMFACDELSRSDIDGVTSYVALSGSLPPGWPGVWKAVDNTYHPITSVDAWKEFVASMVATGNANFSKAQSLKKQLAAALTYDQIKAIKW